MGTKSHGISTDSKKNERDKVGSQNRIIIKM